MNNNMIHTQTTAGITYRNGHACYTPNLGHAIAATCKTESGKVYYVPFLTSSSATCKTESGRVLIVENFGA